MNQPIKRTAHGAIDYAFVAVNLFGPSLLGLTGPARALPAALAAGQGGLNAFTAQPLAVKPLVSFRTHGTLEAATLPLSLLVAWRTGALAERRARAFFAGLFLALGAVYALTDWESERRDLSA